ncbi:MAG: hypothetical protein WC184_12325 [Acidimicrobiia bacterium]
MVFSALNSLQVLSAVLAVFLLVLVGALIFTFKTKPQSQTAADDTSEIAKRVAEANAWGNEIRATNKRKKRGRRNKNSNNPEGTLEDAKQRVSILQGQIELLRHTAEQTRLHASKITTQIADAEQHNDQERLETLLAQRSALYAEADRQLEAVNVAEQEVGQLTLKWELNTTTQPDLIEGSPWLTSPTTQPAESTNLSQALETDRTETDTSFLLDFPETSFEPAETFEPSEANTELDSATAETDGVASPAGTSEVLHPKPLNRRSEATVRRRLKHLGMSSALSESDVQMLNTASASITNVEVVDHLQYGLPEEIPERSTVSFTPVDATQT